MKTIALIVILQMFVIQVQSEPQTKAEQLDPKNYIDIEGFFQVSGEAAELRKDRLISIEEFNEMSLDSNTVILDSRSASAFRAVHIEGAININFSDFTEEKLRMMIPDSGTRILIYCNNNFESGNPALTAKRVSLALNIPTFINLYGYGYKNVYELKDRLRDNDPRVNLVVHEAIQTN